MASPSPMPLRSYKSMGPESHPQSSSGGSIKGLNIQYVVQLTEVGEGLMAKMYRLNQILDRPDPVNHVFSESFWKAGVIPNFPKICTLVARKFPEHTSKLQLERVDKIAFDSLSDGAEVYLQNLEPWVQLLLDLMEFREQALRLLLDLSSTVITLLPHQNSFILHAFMDLFCSFVRVNLFSEKIPGKMMLQMYNLLHGILRNDRDCDFYHRLVQFIDSYDPPVKGLQEDLNFVSPRIGEVLEAVGPVIFLSADTRKLRNEGFLSPFHPRYPDILMNSAHPMRAQDLANVTSYREWVLLGYLVCPDELLRVTSIDIALVVLKENLVLTLFRDEHILLLEDYQLYVLPRILESKRIAKAGRTKQKEADLEYSVAKQVEKMIRMEEEKVLSNLQEERETSAIDGELRAVMAEFMVGVINFEELVEVGNKFLIRFRQALEILRRPSIYESSELVKSILKENETKRVNAYIEAGCTNAYDGEQSVTQLNTCITELQNCLTKAKGIVNELENLMEKAGNALCMNSNDQSEKSLHDYEISKTCEKLDAAGCASFMSVIYSMVKQDYMMQERIVSSLNLKLGGELESYCLLWTLRPFIDDDVIHLALRQVR